MKHFISTELIKQSYQHMDKIVINTEYKILFNGQIVASGFNNEDDALQHLLYNEDLRQGEEYEIKKYFYKQFYY